MEELLVLGSVVSTSLMAWWFGRRVVGLSRVRFTALLVGTFESLGLTVIFLVLNLALGIVSVLAIRGLTTRFVSLYTFGDVGLVLLSLLQGLIVRSWWQAGAPGSPGAPSARA